jgi:probable F420-dependent oxidoreductase
MNFGFRAPNRGPNANPNALATLVQRGEAMGFNIVSVSDHVVMPKSIDSTYPYSESGASMGGAETMELLTILSYLAGVTSKIRLLTSVMVVPHRPAVLTAKILSTIDVLSKGRVIVGCGAGWMREEFEAIEAHDFDRRGAVTNEYIRAFKELWTSDDPTFDGEFTKFANIHFEPKPVQKPHPPIWIGGESNVALRRVARLGDAWYPIGMNPTYPVGTVAQMTESLSRIHAYAEEAGRDPAEIGVAYNVTWNNDQEATTLPDGTRRSFTGNAEQIAEDIKAFEAIGVKDILFGFDKPELADTLEGMERFATNVMPLTK